MGPVVERERLSLAFFCQYLWELLLSLNACASFTEIHMCGHQSQTSPF